MELIVTFIGIIAIVTILTYITWRLYRKMLAKISTKILKEISGGEDEKVTIKDLQGLAEYLRIVKKTKDMAEKNKDYDIMYT